MSVDALSNGTRIATKQHYKTILLALCKHIQCGRLTIVDDQERYEFSQPSPTPGMLSADIHVHHPDFYRQVVRQGSNGAAQSYIDGHWTSPHLVEVIRLMVANQVTLDRVEKQSSAWFHFKNKIRHWLNRNSLAGSKRNILAHYDLSNSFYKLFLDSRLMYSAALYDEQATSLEQASENKLRSVCEKLALSEQDHLLEVGSGWGGLAIYAAQHYGCRVTTTTISDAQYAEAKERIKSAGLDHKITLLKQDYRELQGQYDKVVSIEMVEAVGHQYLDGYFSTLSDRLKPHGKLLIQAITIDDQRYQQALTEVDFIKKYIFPGSFIPSFTTLAHSAAQSGFRVVAVEDLGASYAETLKDWRHNFERHLNEIEALGFDKPFQRLWNFYLCYCEGGFREKLISDVHILFTQPMKRAS